MVHKNADVAWRHYREQHRDRDHRQFRRRDFDAGFRAGQDDAATEIANLIDDNLDLIKSFAEDKAPEMIAHLLRHLSRDV